MNERITALYVAILNNEVVCFDTNLKDFIIRFSKIEAQAKKYDHYYRRFRSESKFTQTLDGKEYFFQRLI